MPLYDFECRHGHRFEKMVRMDDRKKPVSCDGQVNQIITDDELIARHKEDSELELPDHHEWVDLEYGIDAGQGELVSVPRNGQVKMLVKKVPCMLDATMLVTHANPKCMLSHGFAANRDAAREGRYDPHTPSTRIMSKGREWRK